MPKVILSARAKRDFETLDMPVKDRVKTRLKDLERDPWKHSSKLTNSKLGTYRSRVGDFRIVFDVEGDAIIVLRIGNRRDIYNH